MKSLREITAEADECSERGEYSRAQKLYEEALEQEVPGEGLVLCWFTARGEASLAKVRSLVGRWPNSAQVRRLHLMILSKEREYSRAADAATTALAMFGSDPRYNLSFRGLRLQASVEMSRLREPAWDLISEDVMYLWSAHAAAENRERIYLGIVHRLLRVRGEGAPDGLRAVAEELGRTHTDLADVLRSHAATLDLCSKLRIPSLPN